jgi:hypothetical protein
VLLGYNASYKALESLSVAATTAINRYVWTEAGRQRVAAAIQATLHYNSQKKIHPKALRPLSRLAGFKHHTSLGEYQRGNIADPNRENCMVLRQVAKYIYKVSSFQVNDTVGMERFKNTIHLEPSTEPGAGKYWEQGITYQWQELAELGTKEGERFEEYVGNRVEDKALQGEFLLDRFRYLSGDRIRLLAQLLDVPTSTLHLIAETDNANFQKSDFRSLEQVIRDFLLRITPQKNEVWLVQRLADAANLSIDELERFMSGQSCKPEIFHTLSALFKNHGVPWEAEDLQVLYACST